MTRKNFKFFSGISLYIIGVAVLFMFISPVIAYELSSSRFEKYLTPVPEEEIDFTKAGNWFPTQDVVFDESSVTHYSLSIPKLNIKDATVAMGGEDLADSLIQYPGTAAPGNVGNAVVFGHSILPQFYNPKDYTAIFSTLPTLKKGDDIFVRYDGIDLQFEVEDMFEVRPTDVQVLDQNDKGIYLSLITCTPPGHPLKPKRLVVRAKLVPPNEQIVQADSGN